MPVIRLALTQKPTLSARGWLGPGRLNALLNRRAQPAARGVGRGDGPRVALVYNPQSGHFSPPVLAELTAAFEASGRQVICYDSLSFCAIDEGPFDIICMLGGDGTARTVISANWPVGSWPAQNRAAQNRTAHNRAGANWADWPEAGAARFCTYPAGTINLVAREAGYPQQVAAFVRRCLSQAEERRHFVGRLGDQLFQCCASVGPDAVAVARVSARVKRRFGRLAYGVAVAGMLRHWHRHRLDVTVDGHSFAAEAVFVCKGRYYAGAWMLDSAADLAEDSFRVLALPRARRRDLARLALAVVVHKGFADKRWLRMSARAVRIGGTLGLPVQADGDVVAATPVDMAINPVPLPFL